MTPSSMIPDGVPARPALLTLAAHILHTRLSLTSFSPLSFTLHSCHAGLLKPANIIASPGPLHILSSLPGEFSLTYLVFYSNIKVSEKYFLSILYN